VLVGHVSAAQAASAYVQNEKFNTMATGSAPASPWALTSIGGGSVTVVEVHFPANKSVKNQKLSPTGASILARA